jgi:chromosomal replication initiation ATPase DnaA
MSKDSDDVESLLIKIQEGLNKFGVEKLNMAISKILLQDREDKTKEIEFCINLVCGHFGISTKTIYSKSARGDLQDAKQIAYCLLHFNLHLPIRFIATNVFRNWHTSVANGIKRLKTADITHKQERVFIETYEYLRVRLIENLNTIYSNHNQYENLQQAGEEKLQRAEIN